MRTHLAMRRNTRPNRGKRAVGALAKTRSERVCACARRGSSSGGRPRTAVVAARPVVMCRFEGACWLRWCPESFPSRPCSCKLSIMSGMILDLARPLAQVGGAACTHRVSDGADAADADAFHDLRQRATDRGQSWLQDRRGLLAGPRSRASLACT